MVLNKVTKEDGTSTGPNILAIDTSSRSTSVAVARGARDIFLNILTTTGLVQRYVSGSVFVGPWAPESAGDYATGANHVLPTGGLARSCGPLSVEAFGRYSQVQRIDRAGLSALADTVRTLATAEGLTAHRNAVDARFRTASDR